MSVSSFMLSLLQKNKNKFIITLWILASATSASYMALLHARLFSFEFYYHSFPNCSLNWSVSCLVLSSSGDRTTSKTKKSQICGNKNSNFIGSNLDYTQTWLWSCDVLICFNNFYKVTVYFLLGMFYNIFAKILNFIFS